MSTTEMTLANFETTLTSNDIVVVDAWASWCGPCRAFAPVFEAAAARHPDVVWAKLDTQREGQLAGAFGIRAIPTLMVFRQGVLLIQQSGMLPGRVLDEIIEKTRALDMNEVRAKIEADERAQASAGADPKRAGAA